jgi:hypothetical protein
MKPRPPLKPLMGFNNVVSINLLRLRRLVARLDPAIVDRVGKAKPQHGHMRRAAIRDKTGGNCKG